MSKEELFDQGWELYFSGPCDVVAWGKYMVGFRHGSERMVHGYGNDEQSAINDAVKTIQKEPEATHEIHH